ILAVRLSLCGFFTIFSGREFSLYLLVELKNSRLGMAGQTHSGHSEALADNGDEAAGLDLILIGHERGRIGAEYIVAEMDDGASVQIGPSHMIAVQSQGSDRGVY